jgi:PEP-CTERM motif
MIAGRKTATNGGLASGPLSRKRKMDMQLSKRVVAVACLTLMALAGSASATVISGNSSASGVTISLTGAIPVAPLSLPTLSNSAPAPYSNNTSLLSVPVPGVLSTGVANLSVSSNVDGLAGARQAAASAEVNNVNLGLNILLTPVLSLTTSKVTATSTVTGEPLASVGTATILSGVLTIDSQAPIAIPVNPTVNQVLVNSNGVLVTLNEQIISGALGLTVNAIHIQLTNALGLGVNGNIILSQAQAALVSNVPEPSTALLVGLGLTLLGVRRRPRA